MLEAPHEQTHYVELVGQEAYRELNPLRRKTNGFAFEHALVVGTKYSRLNEAALHFDRAG
jgi:hypothetical protein